jgi:hypothetical protein
MTENNFLKLPDVALLSVIVGGQGPYDEVRAIVGAGGTRKKSRESAKSILSCELMGDAYVPSTTIAKSALDFVTERVLH